MRFRVTIASVDETSRPALRRAELTATRIEQSTVVGTSTGLSVAYCGAFSRSPASRSRTLRLDATSDENSWWVGAIRMPDRVALVLGAEEALRFVTEVLLGETSLIARQHLEGLTLGEGESLDLDAFWLACAHGEPQRLLEQFADRLALAHDAHPGDSPCGWGSWGHWLERIDLSLMRETILTLDGMTSLREVVNVIQIDDGWTELLDTGRVSATWRPNRRFPLGIAPLAAEISRTGRACGLWLLPFTVNAGSPLLDQHPSWFVADGAGSPVRVGGGDSYCLDPTHPGAAEWLRELFGRLLDWNVTYVKLDFLRALLSPDPGGPSDNFDCLRVYANARTRVEAYRAGLKLVRDALGPDATVVACSAPAAPGAGLVSAHRVGPDIDPHWIGATSGVRDAARALIANWFWHGRTWVNDPDYVLICESEAVTQFWATVVAMSGGSLIISADLACLAGWEERNLAFVSPPIGLAATPVDLFTRVPDATLLHLPLQRGEEEWSLVAVLNWSDAPSREHVELSMMDVSGPTHAWDAWRQEHRIVEDNMHVFVDAQSAVLLRLTSVASHPQIVGTDVHWAQGWLELQPSVWDATSSTLTVSGSLAAPRDGHAWVWVPPALECLETDPPQGGIVRIPLTAGATRLLRFKAVGPPP